MNQSPDGWRAGRPGCAPCNRKLGARLLAPLRGLPRPRILPRSRRGPLQPLNVTHQPSTPARNSWDTREESTMDRLAEAALTRTTAAR